MSGPTYLESNAGFDRDRRFRFELTRIWDRDLPVLPVVGQNPSKADAARDDHTVRKAVGQAQRWGFGGVVLVNFWPHIGTTPAEFKAARSESLEWVAVKNDATIRDRCRQHRIVLAAWGKCDDYGGRRENEVERLIASKIVCTGRTKYGCPRHLSRGAYNTSGPILYRKARRNIAVCEASAWRDARCPGQRNEYERASGDAECIGCGLTLYDHEFCANAEWLRVRCDGSHVKL